MKWYLEINDLFEIDVLYSYSDEMIYGVLVVIKEILIKFGEDLIIVMIDG